MNADELREKQDLISHQWSEGQITELVHHLSDDLLVEDPLLIDKMLHDGLAIFLKEKRITLKLDPERGFCATLWTRQHEDYSTAGKNNLLFEAKSIGNHILTLLPKTHAFADQYGIEIELAHDYQNGGYRWGLFTSQGGNETRWLYGEDA